MNPLNEAWSKIINSLQNEPIELPTTPKANRIPIWFTVSTRNNKIFINRATVNSPSSKISKERILTFSEFEKIYPIHLKREMGESVSKEATQTTRNQVYWFSIIKYLA